MNVYFQPKARQKLESKLNWLKGPGLRGLAENVAEALIEGNRIDRLSGLDCNGRPQTPVKPRHGKYRLGTGPPLAPFGAASRVVRNFRAAVTGTQGSFTITAGWDNVVSSKGVPFLPFHDMGVQQGPGAKARSGEKPTGGFFRKLGRALASRAWKVPGRVGWFLPRRPIFGVSPRTWRTLDDLIRDYKRGVPR